MFDKLDQVEQKYQEIEAQLSDPDIFQDMERYQKLTRERAKLTALVESYQRFKKISEELESNKELLHGEDDALRELAKEEIATLKKDREGLEEALSLPGIFEP